MRSRVCNFQKLPPARDTLSTADCAHGGGFIGNGGHSESKPSFFKVSAGRELAILDISPTPRFKWATEGLRANPEDAVYSCTASKAQAERLSRRLAVNLVRGKRSHRPGFECTDKISLGVKCTKNTQGIQSRKLSKCSPSVL